MYLLIFDRDANNGFQRINFHVRAAKTQSHILGIDANVDPREQTRGLKGRSCFLKDGQFTISY
jgi:hypothetical protein